MKGALALAIALLTLAAGRAGGETLPRAGPIDPRIRSAAYSPDQVYRLYGFVGFHIDLEFEPGETFEALSGGDLEGLTYSAHANVLTLKPKVARTEMNLAVTTSKRRYYFEYSVSPRRPDPLTSDVMYAVRFNYPPTPASPDGLTDEERIALELAKGREVALATATTGSAVTPRSSPWGLSMMGCRRESRSRRGASSRRSSS